MGRGEIAPIDVVCIADDMYIQLSTEIRAGCYMT